MNIEKMREEFEKFRDARNALLESEGHKPGSKWHVTNAHYPTWQASFESMAPAWRPMTEDPPFPFTGDIFVAGKVVIGASWCSGYWQSMRRGCLDRDAVSHWKPSNPEIEAPAIHAVGVKTK